MISFPLASKCVTVKFVFKCLAKIFKPASLMPLLERFKLLVPSRHFASAHAPSKPTELHRKSNSLRNERNERMPEDCEHMASASAVAPCSKIPLKETSNFSETSSGNARNMFANANAPLFPILSCDTFKIFKPSGRFPNWSIGLRLLLSIPSHTARTPLSPK